MPKYKLTVLGRNSEFSLECAHISQDGKCGRGNAGVVPSPREYVPK
jgi:hypothetical protein